MKFTMLGSGTSSGVPRVGTGWGDCDPKEPRNRRRRVSALVECGGQSVLIDTSPDLREQLLDADVQHLDAVLFTHDHADHAHGIDDLRPLVQNMGGQPLACHADADTLSTLLKRFNYIFNGAGGYPPIAKAVPLEARFSIGPMMVQSFTQIHGERMSMGFRFDQGGRALAYSTDINGLTEECETCLHGLDLWVVDALRIKPHPTHTHLALTLDWIAHFKPKLAVLTHMDVSMDYQSLCRTLPDGVIAGYDGLIIDVSEI